MVIVTIATLACAAVSHERLATPPGYLAVSVILEGNPKDIRPGQQIDIYADLRNYDPFPSQSDASHTGTTLTRIIRGVPVLDSLGNGAAIIAVDYNESHYLGLFQTHKARLIAKPSDLNENRPREVIEMRPLFR